MQRSLGRLAVPGLAAGAAFAGGLACRAAAPRRAATDACSAVVARARARRGPDLREPERPYFYEFEVQRPAGLVAGGPHPPRTGLSGGLLVQYVVDSAGRVDPATVEVLPSFHPGRPPDPPPAPVREAAAAWRFRPAAVEGCPVPQLLQSRLDLSAGQPGVRRPPNVTLQATGVRGRGNTPSTTITRDPHSAVQARA